MTSSVFFLHPLSSTYFTSLVNWLHFQKLTSLDFILLLFSSPRTQTPHKVCHTCFQNPLSVSLFLMPSWIYEPYLHASLNHSDLLEFPHVLSIWHLTTGISHITKPNTCTEFLVELIFKLSLWAVICDTDHWVPNTTVYVPSSVTNLFCCPPWYSWRSQLVITKCS